MSLLLWNIFRQGRHPMCKIRSLMTKTNPSYISHTANTPLLDTSRMPNVHFLRFDDQKLGTRLTSESSQGRERGGAGSLGTKKWVSIQRFSARCKKRKVGKMGKGKITKVLLFCSFPFSPFPLFPHYTSINCKRLNSYKHGKIANRHPKSTSPLPTKV
jgi:hypothetical protein